MDYKNTENWILSRVPIFQNKGKVAYNPGLKNVSEFIKELNLPNNQLKFIHIGGTNGKGSTSSYVSSISNIWLSMLACFSASACDCNDSHWKESLILNLPLHSRCVYNLSFVLGKLRALK